MDVVGTSPRNVREVRTGTTRRTLGSIRPHPSVARLPDEPGVYRFRDCDGRVLYVGRAVRLRRRVASYWSDLRDRRHLAPMVARIASVEAVACDSEHEAAWLERNLLEHRLPRWNRTPGGQEVPTWIRVDPRPASPGLRAAHTGTADGCFGPYLGGDRVRTAVAALHRVLPLAYAGTSLTGAERDLAAKLGVGPEDRERLAAVATAVLRRDPAAVESVRADLTRRRDRAAEALSFELAGRLQAELEAVAWVTAPQRVTATEPANAAVSGWSAGVLVRFEIRDGRLCTWAQRASAESGAVRHLAATPPQWVEFARRNAELATRLVVSR
jgi:excinuclease ABC subunit C